MGIEAVGSLLEYISSLNREPRSRPAVGKWGLGFVL
jgi:hypothetical protein